jgi:glycerophosphoryl diester phosphodiesterase
MLAQIPKPALIAHRGSSSYAPENTISAFELAVTQTADAIELDVQLSSDGYVVVMHDSTVNRTTDGIGSVREMTLASLKKLDAGAYYDVAFRGERIPTLEEVFEAVGKCIFINIELKPDLSMAKTLAYKVAQAVELYSMTESVLFSSFDPLVLWRMKKLSPRVPCGLLALPGLGGWPMRHLGRRIVPCQALHPHFSSVSKGLTNAVHQSGQRLYVYTVNEPDEMRRMVMLGVDGIITDNPELARKIIEPPNNV